MTGVQTCALPILVVDLLRATTQITTFFDGGGNVLVPLRDVDEAFRMKERLGEEWKIMGERGGLPAPGFDFGNSPLELLDAGVPEFAIITTSNGTRALMRAADGCRRVLAGLSLIHIFKQVMSVTVAAKRGEPLFNEAQ